jgi:hypothetical protein
MKRALIAAAMLLSTFVPASAQSKMDYGMDEFPKRHPVSWVALRRALPTSLKKVPWIYDLHRAAVTSYVYKVTTRGKVHYGGTACKPHDCGDNGIAFLVAEDGSNVVALVRTSNQVGRPNDEEFAILYKLLSPGDH